MNTSVPTKRIAIIGGGPAALFLYKRLIKTSADVKWDISIFEKGNYLGMGMPYSDAGANMEHVTNVSANEIPEIATPILEWIPTLSPELLKIYNIDIDRLSEYKVFPRLLFGLYLHAQFYILFERAKELGIVTTIYLQTKVTDIQDLGAGKKIIVEVPGNQYEFDKLIICTGHTWPLLHEGKVPGYYDSPYPPAKLNKCFNHEIALRGSSLTAIDAIRTLARTHGCFIKNGSDRPYYKLHEEAADFKITMHTKHGLLPALRFHLEDSHLSKDGLLTNEQLQVHRNSNDGFFSLDFIFEKDFKQILKEKDPEFYEQIKELNLEGFVETMMQMRERVDPFDFFKEEYDEAKNSIRRKESVYWKELLAILSFALNYPAKYLSAEDMLRLQQVLMPLISIVIAFVPQSSGEEILALEEAGLLTLIPVGDNNEVNIDPAGGIYMSYKNETGKAVDKKFETFIDCIGQRHLSIKEFPFEGLTKNGDVSAARVKFKNAQVGKDLLADGNKEVEKEEELYYLKVPGLAITDNFKAISKENVVNDRLYIMAVPFIGGFNPDYSGLDFCEAASQLIVNEMKKDILAE